MRYIGPALAVIAAIAILIKRREFTSFQANILGGSILPGCAVAEAVALLAIAAALFFLS